MWERVGVEVVNFGRNVEVRGISQDVWSNSVLPVLDLNEFRST